MNNISMRTIAGRIQWLTLGKGTKMGEMEKRLLSYSLSLNNIIIFTICLCFLINNKKKNVDKTPASAWERTLWSWRLLSAAGWRGKQAHGTGLVLRRPHDGRHGNLLPRSGWRRRVRMVCGFPVSRWGETIPRLSVSRVIQRPKPSRLALGCLSRTPNQKGTYYNKLAMPRRLWTFQTWDVWPGSLRAINTDAELVLANLPEISPMPLPQHCA